MYVLNDTLYPSECHCNLIKLQVKGLPPCKTVSAGTGGWHALALTENGCLYSWGHGSGGKLGTGAELDLWSPECVFFKDGMYV